LGRGERDEMGRTEGERRKRRVEDIGREGRGRREEEKGKERNRGRRKIDGKRRGVWKNRKNIVYNSIVYV